jgi:dCTP deaminase
LGTNSYDCRLGPWYYLPPPTWSSEPLDPLDPAAVRAYWGKPRDARREGGRIVFPPGETVLAHTLEVVGGREAITTSMRARSSIGRLALSVAKCAGVGDVGYVSRWTMEISNHGRRAVALPVGLRVCQLEFLFVGETTRAYAGKYGQGGDAWTPEDMLPRLWQDWDVVEGRLRYDGCEEDGNGPCGDRAG